MRISYYCKDSRQELPFLSNRTMIGRGSSRKIFIIVKGDLKYNGHGVFTKNFPALS